MVVATDGAKALVSRTASTQAAPMALQQAPRDFGSASRTKRELSIRLLYRKRCSCGNARNWKGSRTGRNRLVLVAAPGPCGASAGASFFLKNAGSVAMVYWLPPCPRGGSNHFQRPELGAA